jgi:hypothetical protein
LIASIFDTNCTGAIYGCKVALAGMKKQHHGAIYNLEGLGSSGGLIRGRRPTRHPSERWPTLSIRWHWRLAVRESLSARSGQE